MEQAGEFVAQHIAEQRVKSAIHQIGNAFDVFFPDYLRQTRDVYKRQDFNYPQAPAFCGIYSQRTEESVHPAWKLSSRPGRSLLGRLPL